MTVGFRSALKTHQTTLNSFQNFKKELSHVQDRRTSPLASLSLRSVIANGAVTISIYHTPPTSIVVLQDAQHGTLRNLINVSVYPGGRESLDPLALREEVSAIIIPICSSCLHNLVRIAPCY